MINMEALRRVVYRCTYAASNAKFPNNVIKQRNKQANIYKPVKCLNDVITEANNLYHERKHQMSYPGF